MLEITDDYSITVKAVCGYTNLAGARYYIREVKWDDRHGQGCPSHTHRISMALIYLA